MINAYQKKILILAIYAGEIMMKNGAEIYRVEDTITRICKACGRDRSSHRSRGKSGRRDRRCPGGI